jgi:hypothetical protein
MEEQHKAVFGIFQDQDEIKGLVRALKDAGLRESDVQILQPCNRARTHFRKCMNLI